MVRMAFWIVVIGLVTAVLLFLRAVVELIVLRWRNRPTEEQRTHDIQNPIQKKRWLQSQSLKFSSVP